MAERPDPLIRTTEKLCLVGTMAVYDSEAEASLRIPDQWRDFLASNAALGSNSQLYGASPSTCDGKIHYLAGVAQDCAESLVAGEPLILEAGEYAVVRVDDTALRDTWIWLLETWLPQSGRRERQAAEFERYSRISEGGTPVGPVEIWIPLEPLEAD